MEEKKALSGALQRGAEEKRVLSSDEKRGIALGLRDYVDRYPSQNKAAASLKGVSAATLSVMLQGLSSGEWPLVNDKMWRNVASQIARLRGPGAGWQLVETQGWKDMVWVMDDAQRWQNVTWVVGDAGCGKTTAARAYAEEHKEVFYVLCSEDMRKNDFIREVARTIGARVEGRTLREMLGLIIDDLVQMDAPLLLFDEADKLSERVFHYFIDLYNRLEDKCGIVFFSTNYIERRMATGLRYNKCGYNELHSRIGRKFFRLDETSVTDVRAICQANGLDEKGQVSEVVKDAERYGFDLRRVKKAVHRVKRMEEGA